MQPSSFRCFIYTDATLSTLILIAYSFGNMQKKQHILIVSYYFYPYADIGAKRMSELAKYLRNKGHKVTVITADRREGNIHSALMADLNDINIIKTWDPPSLIDSLWKKIKGFRTKKTHSKQSNSTLNEVKSTQTNSQNETVFFLKRYLFSFQALFDAKKTWVFVSILKALTLSFRQPFDVIITSSPPTVSHAVGLLVQFFYKTRWFMDLRDPLSQPDITLNKTKTRLRTCLETIFEGLLIKRSDKIICASPGIEKNLSNNTHASKKMLTLLNGFDGELAAKASPSENAGLRLLYAGQLYVNRNPFPLIDALKNLISRGDIDAKKIMLDFYGSCDKWNGIYLNDYLALHNMTSVVRVHGHLASNELESEINNADILINFAQGQKNQIPAKSYESMQKGKYSLVFTEPDSDTATLIQATNSGLILDETNPSQIENAIKNLYHKKTQGEEMFTFDRNAVKNFSREQQNNKFCALIEEDTIRG